MYILWATWLNDLENYRTETEYQDQLILKVVVFQFINSYITLIYIGFINAAGYKTCLGENCIEDNTGRPYTAMCGFLPGSDAQAPWVTNGDIPGVQGANGYFHYANFIPECNATLTTGCCDFEADTLALSGCQFVIVQRDCSSDLRKLLISYTLLKAVYDGLLQILVPVLMMVYGQYVAQCLSVITTDCL